MLSGESRVEWFHGTKDGLSMTKVSHISEELVSIVVTSYNHAEFLDQRMESLLRQTYSNIEIIVVDDCSTDGSAIVLEKYRNHNRVRLVLMESNGGYAKTTNVGIGLCRGEYVMIAECDDYNDPTHVETLYRKLVSDEKIGVAFCCSDIVNEMGLKLGEDFSCREKTFKKLCSDDVVISRWDMQRFLLKACVIPNMSATLMRKRYFCAVGGLSEEFKACADWDFWCRMAQVCDFSYTRKSLNYFRTHLTSVRNTSGIRRQFSEILRLLYRASSGVELSPMARFRFRVNVGAIWAAYIKPSPLKWFMSFPHLCMERNSNVFYLFMGFVQIAFLYVLRRLTHLRERNVY